MKNLTKIKEFQIYLYEEEKMSIQSKNICAIFVSLWIG